MKKKHEIAYPQADSHDKPQANLKPYKFKYYNSESNLDIEIWGKVQPDTNALLVGKGREREIKCYRLHTKEQPSSHAFTHVSPILDAAILGQTAKPRMFEI
jgi:hypothetical protein